MLGFVVGFDVNKEKVALMQQGIDSTGEVPEDGSVDAVARACCILSALA